MLRSGHLRMTANGAPLPRDASVETAAALEGVAREHGTPAYAYDVGALERRWTATRQALPREVPIHYSLKANPSLGLSALLAGWGAGVEVASAGEVALALEAGFDPAAMIVSGPHKPPDLVDLLARLPGAVVSVDSLSELALLPADLPCRLLLRLRCDFASGAAIPLDQRFGIPLDELAAADLGPHVRRRIAGFHVHGGSQLLDAEALAASLRRSLALALTAAVMTGVTPSLIDVGGGFGVPYGPDDVALDLAGVAEALRDLADEAAPATLSVELGRYLVADCGWYVTRVLGTQVRDGRPAVVVDGGTHHRSDLCGLGLARCSSPPLVLGAAGAGPATPTDVLGCLCLPDDVLAERVALPHLEPGALLAFDRAGAYGLTGAPSRFLSHPEPVEVAFRGDRAAVLRPRGRPDALLEGQRAATGLGTSPAAVGGPA